MYITVTRKKYKETYHEQILLRESYREDGKVKNRTILNLTHKPKEQVLSLIAALKSVKATAKESDIYVNIKEQSQGFTIGLSFVIVFIMKLLHIIPSMGKSFEAKVALVLIAARITHQSSRIQALYWAKEEDKILDLLSFDVEQKERLDKYTIYTGLDYMQQHQEKIEDALFGAYYKKNPPKVLYYDVTSSYVEGDYKESDLVAYGYNRDRKKGKQQIVIGLLTDEEGHAISIHTYPGNTNDVKTFTDQLDKLKNRFHLQKITIVGDGGMIKSEDIVTIKEMGYDYITSIGKPSIRALMKDQNLTIEMSLFDENLKEVVDEKNSVRYILRQNPIRMEEIRKSTQERIEALKAYAQKRAAYYNTHYGAKKQTLQKDIDQKISQLKLGSFLSCALSHEEGECAVKNGIKTKELAQFEITEDKRAKNTFGELDGCYVIKTSLMDSIKDTKEDVHTAYKALINVENAFKTLKTDFLEIRPLYLKTDKRIIGHIALSMIAYNITRKLKAYITLADLDFKSTIRRLSTITTTINKIKGTKLSFESIAQVSDDVKCLFESMGLKMPVRI